MSPTALPTPTFEPLDQNEYDRQRYLLKCLHCAKPVMVDGKEQFVKVLHARQAGGRIEGEVWMTGSPDPVDLKLINIPAAKP